VSQVRAGTYANLEHFALSRGDDLLANLPDGFRIAQLAYEKGIDVVSVQGQAPA
jgi:hypothetical protein